MPAKLPHGQLHRAAVLPRSIAAIGFPCALPTNTRVRFERHHLSGGNWPGTLSEPFGPVEAEDTIGAVHAAKLDAQWSSFYEIAIFVPERRQLTLCVQWK